MDRDLNEMTSAELWAALEAVQEAIKAINHDNASALLDRWDAISIEMTKRRLM